MGLTVLFPVCFSVVSCHYVSYVVTHANKMVFIDGEWRSVGKDRGGQISFGHRLHPGAKDAQTIT